MNLGENIRKHRKANNLSAKSLGDKLGCSAQAILQYERNERTPSIDILNKIAKELCTTLEVLINKDLHCALPLLNMSELQDKSKHISYLNNNSSNINETTNMSIYDNTDLYNVQKYTVLEKDSLFNLIKCVDDSIDLDNINDNFVYNLLQSVYDLIEFKMYKYSKSINTTSIK